MLTITPIEKLITQLREDAIPFSPKFLLHFSDLDSASISVLRDSWLSLQVERRRALMVGLAELADLDPLQLFEAAGKVGLEDTDDDVVIAAIDLLFEADDKHLIDRYIAFLKDKSRKENLRAAAANALVPYYYLCALEELDETVQSKIQNALLEAYEQDRSDLVRRRVLETLGYCDKPELKDMILRALALEQVYWTESALLAIGRSMDNSWDQTVIDYFDHENPIILAQAVHAAGLLGIHRARKLLFKLLNLHTDYDVRQEVIWALSQIGGDEVIERLEHFANVTDDEDEIELIEDSIEYLEMFGSEDPKMASFLIDRRSGEDDKDEEDEFDDEDEDEDFFKTPMDMEEWERYVDDDDEYDDDDEFSEDFDEDDEDFYQESGSF
jgi:HEAT repeat protein